LVNFREIFTFWSFSPLTLYAAFVFLIITTTHISKLLIDQK